MFKFLCILLLVPAVVYGRAWGPCGNGEPHPGAIRVSNCNADQEAGCYVRRGQPSQIQLLFNTVGPSSQIGAQLHAQVSGMWFPWGLGNNADVCANLATGRCPANHNTQLIYGFGLTIPGAAPSGTDVIVRIRSWNQARAVQFCVLIRVRVV